MSPLVVPVEIFHYILEQLLIEFYWSENQTALDQCSLVCRAWRVKAQQLLFRRFRVARFILTPRSVYEFRDFLYEDLPHIHNAIQELQLGPISRHSASAISIAIEIFPFVITPVLPKLPALRHIIYTGDIVWRLSPQRHRLLSYHTIRISSVTSLLLDQHRIAAPTDLCWLLLPYPNLRDLILANVYCIGPPEHFGSLPWPTSRHREKLPRLRCLKLAIGAHPNGAHVRLDQCDWPTQTLAMKLFFTMFASSLERLEIGCENFLCVVDPSRIGEGTLPSQILGEFPNLRRFECYLRTPEFARFGPPYQYLDEIVARVPDFLRSLACPQLQRLGLHFDGLDVTTYPKDDVLAGFRRVGAELARLVDSARFPQLHRVDVDIGVFSQLLHEWVSELVDCFPLLAEKGYLHIVPYIFPPAGLYGPFDNRLDWQGWYYPYYVNSDVGIFPP